jgi:hypothetical protein
MRTLLLDSITAGCKIPSSASTRRGLGKDPSQTPRYSVCMPVHLSVSHYCEPWEMLKPAESAIKLS